SKVTAPVEVTWTVEDFDVTGPTTDASPDAGYFGVLLDRVPQPPGEPFSWFVRGDEPCLRSPRCPSLKYYAGRGIFTTEDTTFTLPTLPRPPEGDKTETHHVNIILLDGQGRRIGESVWIVDFELDREGA
ncbi:MAG: hypothetical protein LC808_17630, partial [Actinobacteria bacterium]|nr:hypothetical protein [Actinomycetota bacterium]